MDNIYLYNHQFITHIVYYKDVVLVLQNKYCLINKWSLKINWVVKIAIENCTYSTYCKKFDKCLLLCRMQSYLNLSCTWLANSQMDFKTRTTLEWGMTNIKILCRQPIRKCFGLCFGFVIKFQMLIWEMAFVFRKSKQGLTWVNLKKLARKINCADVSFCSNKQFCSLLTEESHGQRQLLRCNSDSKNDYFLL